MSEWRNTAEESGADDWTEERLRKVRKWQDKNTNGTKPNIQIVTISSFKNNTSLGGRVWNLFKKVKCKKCQIEKRKWRKINTVVSLSAPYIRRLFCCSHTWLMREVQRVQLAFLCHNPHTFPNVRKWMVYHLGHYYTHTHTDICLYILILEHSFYHQPVTISGKIA